MAAAGLIASALRALLLLSPFLLLSVVVGLLILFSSVMPPHMNPQRQPDDAKAAASNTAETARTVLDRNWIFLVALLLSIVMGTTVWRDIVVESAVYQTEALFGQLGASLGMFMASILLLWLSGDKLLDKLKTLMPVVPVACIALNLLNWFIGVWQEGLNIFGGYDSSTGSFLGNILVGFPIMMIIVVFAARLLENSLRSLPPMLTFGILGTICAAFFLLYTSIQIILTLELSRVIDLSLKIIYLVAAVFYLAGLMFSKKQNTDSLADQTLNKAVLRFSLSKREAEVLRLLMQGRSVPYIHETLFISLNTVRTHIKRIYTKVEVHNREELLDVVYGIDRE